MKKESRRRVTSNCVTIEWPLPPPHPPTRESFTVCKQPGQTDAQWKAAVHAAIDEHWAQHPPAQNQCVYVSWEPSIEFQVCPVDDQFQALVHSKIDEQWAANPPE